MGFGLVPKLMTLNEFVNGCYFELFYRIWQLWEPTMSATKM